MLNEIKLTNFQAHKRLVLALRPGLNVVTGSSDTGKSALVRALRFVALHENATGLTTHGETDMSVRVFTNAGDIITRFRNAKEYGYALNGTQKFLACARDQPIPITTALNLTPTNFQSQFDPHFLLSLTPGQVAKEINRIVALEDIDRSLSWLKERTKSTGILLESVEQDITGIEEYLEANKHIPQLGDMLTGLRESAIGYASLVDDRTSLSRLLEEILMLRKRCLRDVARADAAEAALAEGRSLQATRSLKHALESIVREAAAIAALPRLEAARDVLESVITSGMRRAGLINLCFSFEHAEKTILEKLEQQKTIEHKLEQAIAMRSVCSKCGKPL